MICLMMIAGLFLLPAFGQKATSYEFKNAERNPSGYLLSGELYITVADKEIKLTDAAVEAWLVDGGKAVVYSGRDGAGVSDSRG